VDKLNALVNDLCKMRLSFRRKRNYKTASPNCHAQPMIGIHLIDFLIKTFEL
jgi:hypothetical protein